VVPTGTADELASDIGDRLDQAEAALAQARARSAHLAGSIQIVGHPDFLSEVVAPQLGTILESGIRVRLHVGTRSEIERMLIHGEADLGVRAFLSPTAACAGSTCATRPRARWPPGAGRAAARGLAAGTDLATFLAGLPLLSYGLDYPLIDTWLRHNGLNPELTPPAMVGLDGAACAAC
jgi:DNA-binding transcriptional LysR family regulator